MEIVKIILGVFICFLIIADIVATVLYIKEVFKHII